MTRDIFQKGRRLRALRHCRAETSGGGSSVNAGDEVEVLDPDYFENSSSHRWVKCRRAAGTIVATGRPNYEDVWLVGPRPDDFEVMAPAWLAPVKRWWRK